MIPRLAYLTLFLALTACGASTTEPEPEPGPPECVGWWCHAFDNDVVIEPLIPLDSLVADSLAH